MLIPFHRLFARHRIKAPGVLHLGANTGQEAAAYRALGIRQVIWVEALPDVYDKLVEHVKKFSFFSATLCACLSDKDGEDVIFHVANNESQSSSFLELGTHADEHPDTKYIKDVPMKTIRVDTLLAQQGLVVGPGWFLNVDLQGAELLALRGMGSLLNKFDYAYVEVNEKHLYKGCPLVGEVDDYLATFGFKPRETKMTRHLWGDRLYSRL